MHQKIISTLALINILLYLTATSVNGFTAISSKGSITPNVNEKRIFSFSSSSQSLIVSKKLRGGGGGERSTTTDHITASMSISVSAMEAALRSGPYGVLSLTGIASLVVVPLTLFRQAYSFSVGYGYSVFAMAFALTRTFDLSTTTNSLNVLAYTAMFYGARLGTFLVLREWTVPSKQKQLKEFDKTPRLKRVPFAIAVSMFYAFMTCPLMYVARAVSSSSELVLLDSWRGITMNIGVGLALLGAIMEAITDGQKFWIKRYSNKTEDLFVGPTGGFYKLCRHPNYFAEVMYWFGLFIAGVPSFGKSPIAWICSSFGLYGILGIMKGASKRLDGKQNDNYKGQEDYEHYIKDVPASIWPWSRC